MRTSAALCILFGLNACVTAAPTPLERLPSSADVESFVREHWDAGYWRSSEVFRSRHVRPQLVSVSNVTCSYYVVTPQCVFEITARFSSGETTTQRMAEMFRWNDQGRLEVTNVIYD